MASKNSSNFALECQNCGRKQSFDKVVVGDEGLAIEFPAGSKGHGYKLVCDCGKEMSVHYAKRV